MNCTQYSLSKHMNTSMATPTTKRKREIDENFENFPVITLPLDNKRRKTDYKQTAERIKLRALQDVPVADLGCGLTRSSFKMKTTVSSKSLPSRALKTPRRVSMGLPSKPNIMMAKSASTSHMVSRSPLPQKPFDRSEAAQQRSSFTAKMRRSLRLKRASPGTPFSSLRGTLKRKMQTSLRKNVMRGQQDYSLTTLPGEQQYLRFLDAYNTKENVSEDQFLQDRIDREIRIRDGTAKLLAAAKHPQQMLEAAKNMLTTNVRIMSYMSELQKSKTEQVLNKRSSLDGNQLPCTAKISLSNIRIPLMWKDVDHFKNKGDHRRFAVFCLVRIGSKIFDTSLIKDVDRNMTDVCFDDDIIFEEITPDFELSLEVYCHRLVDDLTIASTPRRLRKRINEISNSVGRTVGKRLSGMKDDSEFMSHMLVGPRFEKIARCELSLKDVDTTTNTFELATEPQENVQNELPLFGHFCCSLAAQPDCLINPTTVGNLYVKTPTDDSWQWYWCILKALNLSCWRQETDVECGEPLCVIPITKDSQLSMVDPCESEKEFSLHVTVNPAPYQNVIPYTSDLYQLAMDSEEELTQWWRGLQQHMLDQALWQHACNRDMKMKSFTPNRKSTFFKHTSNLYDDMLIDSPVIASDSPIQIQDMEDSPTGRPTRSRSKSSLASDGAASRSRSNTHSSSHSSSMDLYEQITIEPLEQVDSPVFQRVPSHNGSHHSVGSMHSSGSFRSGPGSDIISSLSQSSSVQSVCDDSTDVALKRTDSSSSSVGLKSIASASSVSACDDVEFCATDLRPASAIEDVALIVESRLSMTDSDSDSQSSVASGHSDSHRSLTDAQSEHSGSVAEELSTNNECAGRKSSLAGSNKSSRSSSRSSSCHSEHRSNRSNSYHSDRGSNRSNSCHSDRGSNRSNSCHSNQRSSRSNSCSSTSSVPLSSKGSTGSLNEEAHTQVHTNSHMQTAV